MKSYWKLNYKGKFIRTLWAIPFTILGIVFLLFISSPITIAASVFLFLLLAQLIDNYKKWKGKSQSHWQKNMDLMLNKIKVPDLRAFALGITFILIIHLLFPLVSNLVPISNWARMSMEGVAYFFTLLFIFIVPGKRHKAN